MKLSTSWVHLLSGWSLRPNSIFRAVNYIPSFNAAHKECSEYSYSQVVSPWKTALESNGEGTSGKRMGLGDSVSGLKSLRKKNAHSRNKAIKTNQTHFLSNSLWNWSFKVYHVCASKRKQRVTIVTPGKNSLCKGTRCAQPTCHLQHQLYTPRVAQWWCRRQAEPAAKWICILQNIHIILGCFKEVHATLLIDWKI